MERMHHNNHAPSHNHAEECIVVIVLTRQTEYSVIMRVIDLNGEIPAITKAISHHSQILKTLQLTLDRLIDYLMD